MDAATFLSPVVTPQGSPAPADTSPAAAPQPEQPTLPNGVTATDVAASNALHEAVQNGVTDLAAEPNYIPTSNLQDQAEKRAREAKTSTLDYVTAAMHQDDFVNGLVASIAAPDSVDPNFNILDPKTYAQWTEGLPDSLKPEMLNVQSAAAAAYRRNLLLDKVHEQTILGDLGWKGNTMRFLGGLVEPGNLALMAATMGVGEFVGGGVAIARATKALKLTTEMAEGPSRAAAVAKATEQLQQASESASGIKGFASATAGAGAMNAGMEALRQRYNFEDDPSGILHAGLIGMTLGAPFAALGARGAARTAEAARNELAVLNTIQAANAHPDVPAAVLHTPEIATVDALHKNAADIMEGTKEYPDIKEVPLEDHIGIPSKGQPGSQSFAFEQDARNAADTLGQQHGIPFDVLPVEHPVNGTRYHLTVPKSPPERTFGFKGDAEEHAFNMGDIYGKPFEAVQDRTGPLGDRWKVQPIERIEPEEVPEGMTKEPVHENVSGIEADPLNDKGQPVGGSVGAAHVGDIGTGEGIAPTFLRSGRLDIYATLNKSQNPLVQELAHRLIKDPLKVKGSMQAQSWTASERKRNIQRTQGGYFHTEAQAAYVDAAKARGLRVLSLARRQFYHDFNERVTLLNRGDPDALKGFEDVAPHIQRAADAAKKVKTALLERAQKAGVKGAEGVTPRDTFVNRVFAFRHIEMLANKHGWDQLYDLVAQSGTWREGATEAEARASAKHYVDAIRKLQFTHVADDIGLRGHDMLALRSELEKANLTPSEIDAVVDSMFEHRGTAEPDSGNMRNLKYRFNLDENASMKMKNGETVKVSDLFENDSKVLMDKYVNAMSGHIALAEKGIKSRADFQALIKDIDNLHMENHWDEKKHAFDRQWLNDLYDNITGRPMSMQQFNTTDRIANATRAWTRSNVLGQLGVAAAFELHKAMAMSGLKAVLTQLPTLRSTINAVRKGHKFDSDLAHDIRTLWGFGSESAAAHAREHEISEFSYDRGLTRYENWANEASHVVDHLSGNAWWTASTRELSTRFAIQRYADLAFGRKKLTDSMRERMVAQGVDGNMIDTMLSHLKQYTERDGDRVTGIRWEDWQQAHQHSFEQFQTAVERDVREAIQEHDIGETMPFMHSTLGKVFAELRTFMLVGHAKNTLKALQYHDALSAQMLMTSIVSDTLAFVLQTSVNFAQDPKQLERRLSPGYIAGSIFQRMSIMGILPAIVGTIPGIPTIPGSTTNTDNRNLLLTPSMNAIGNLLNAANAGIHAANPWDNSPLTSNQMRSLGSFFPGGNLWGMRNLADWMAMGHPNTVGGQKFGH